MKKQKINTKNAVCPFCKGKGIIPKKGKIVCIICEGKGKINPIDFC